MPHSWYTEAGSENGKVAEKKILEKSVVMCSVGHSEHQESQRKASPGLQVRTRFHILSDPNSVSTKLNESA